MDRQTGITVGVAITCIVVGAGISAWYFHPRLTGQSAPTTASIDVATKAKVECNSPPTVETVSNFIKERILTQQIPNGVSIEIASPTRTGEQGDLTVCQAVMEIGFAPAIARQMESSLAIFGGGPPDIWDQTRKRFTFSFQYDISKTDVWVPNESMEYLAKANQVMTSARLFGAPTQTQQQPVSSETVEVGKTSETSSDVGANESDETAHAPAGSR